MLNLDIISDIISYVHLDDKKKILSLNKYHRQLYTLLYEFHVVNNEYIAEIPENIKNLVKIVKNIEKLENIKFYPNLRLTKDYFVDWSIPEEYNKYITCLVLTRNDMNSLKKYPHLENLNLSNTEINDFKILPRNLKKLIIDNHSFNIPLKNIPENLEYLEICSYSFNQIIDCKLFPKKLKKLVIKSLCDINNKIANDNVNLEIILPYD